MHCTCSPFVSCGAACEVSGFAVIFAAQKMSGGAKVALTAAAVVVVVATLINDFGVVLLVTPLVLGLVIFAMAQLPVRQSMQGLMFAALTMPNPNEGFPWRDIAERAQAGTGAWTAPFEKFGCVLLAHINIIDRSNGALTWCAFSGLDVLLVALGIIVYVRRSNGSRLDARDTSPTPPPMNRLARISLLVTLFVWLTGMLRGGDFKNSLWQVNSVVYLPILYLLFQEGLRGPKDYAGLLKVLFFAATYRALFATYVAHTFSASTPDETGSTRLPYASSHADSMLFADAFVAVVVLFVERAAKKTKWRLAALLPVFMLGMVSNNRRLVWVHVLIALGVLYAVTADNLVKRRIRKTLLLSSPAIVAYLITGWGSQFGSFYKPVRTLRTVLDAKSDSTGSSFWRELENFDLVSTLKENPIFGSGYGHPYLEVIRLPDIDYPLERYCPHNSILGVWAYGGLIGFAGVTMLWVAGVFFAMRAYRRATDPEHRAAALMSVTGILVYTMHCWGDLGLGTFTGVFTAAASVAVAAKLAAATGSWGAPAPGAKVRAEASSASGAPARSV